MALATAVALSACGANSGVTREQRTAAGVNSGSAHRVAVADPDAASEGAQARQATIEQDLTTAKHLYLNEIYGPRVHHDLQFVAGDARLVGMLSRGEYAAAQSTAYRLMVGNAIRHITRISFIRGGRELVDATWNANGSFVAAPLSRVLHLGGGRLGTLSVSVQDIVGYVKLITRYSPAQTLVRGASGQVRTSLPAAEDVSLPASGTVSIGGATYQVGSFSTYAWGRAPGREPLTVWVLQPL